MGTTILTSLDAKSLRKAQKAIDKYRIALMERTRVFVRKLAELGYEVAEARIGESPVGKYVHIEIKNHDAKFVKTSRLFATGDIKSPDGRPVNMLLMVEFGAGIRYNSVANPLAAEYGMGVGTFPDQKHAFDEKGWFFMGEDGKWHHSFGIQATMPMYHAYEEILKNISKVARESFATNEVIQC